MGKIYSAIIALPLLLCIAVVSFLGHGYAQAKRWREKISDKLRRKVG